MPPSVSSTYRTPETPHAISKQYIKHSRQPFSTNPQHESRLHESAHTSTMYQHAHSDRYVAGTVNQHSKTHHWLTSMCQYPIPPTSVHVAKTQISLPALLLVRRERAEHLLNDQLNTSVQLALADKAKTVSVRQHLHAFATAVAGALRARWTPAL